MCSLSHVSLRNLRLCVINKFYGTTNAIERINPHREEVSFFFSQITTITLKIVKSLFENLSRDKRQTSRTLNGQVRREKTSNETRIASGAQPRSHGWKSYDPSLCVWGDPIYILSRETEFHDTGGTLVSHKHFQSAIKTKYSFDIFSFFIFIPTDTQLNNKFFFFNKPSVCSLVKKNLRRDEIWLGIAFDLKAGGACPDERNDLPAVTNARHDCQISRDCDGRKDFE